jgi:hypothetical protein
MTAIVIPDIDLDELRKNIPSLSEIELPSMARAGKRADATIDRLLGRSRMPIWPWIAAGVFVAALIATVAAFFTWNRRASWTRESDPWADEPIGSSMSSEVSGTPDLSGTTMTEPTTGLTAAEASLTSSSMEDQPA